MSISLVIASNTNNSASSNMLALSPFVLLALFLHGSYVQILLALCSGCAIIRT